jgi:glycosyltransferase involved in cell wall biosynthesis
VRHGPERRLVKIAEIAPPWFPVPPTGYGGIELIVALLADGLAERGHDVTLFARTGSATAAGLVASPLDPPDAALVGNAWFDAGHAFAAYAAIRDGDFDVVHDHSGIAGPALGAMLRGSPPVVHTLHGPWTGPSRQWGRALQHDVDFVAISRAQQADFPELRYAGLVHNGIRLADYPCQSQKEAFLVHIGRATPDKGPTIAIEVARRADLPLAMIVKRNEPPERAYWDEVVAPLLHDGVEVFEDVSHECKVDLLGRARAMVFPIQWPEPFGLVMVEAMACGTPVLACAAGAAVEIVDDGVTGFLRDSVDGLVAALDEIDRCRPEACRSQVERCFAADVMVRGYETLFEAVVRREIAESGFPLRR